MFGRARQEEEVTGRQESKIRQAHILQEFRNYKAELEKEEKALQALAAKRKSYEIELTRRIEIRQKRKL